MGGWRDRLLFFNVGSTSTVTLARMEWFFPVYRCPLFLSLEFCYPEPLTLAHTQKIVLHVIEKKKCGHCWKSFYFPYQQTHIHTLTHDNRGCWWAQEILIKRCKKKGNIFGLAGREKFTLFSVFFGNYKIIVNIHDENRMNLVTTV